MLGREAIIGRAIQEVRSYAAIEDDCDVVHVYYVLDNGVSFRLPLAGGDFKMETPCPDAGVVRLPQVAGRRIEAALCAVEDGEPIPDSVCLLLDDGSLLTDVPVAPHGVGWAGLHLVKTEDVSHDSLRDFWEVKERRTADAPGG